LVSIFSGLATVYFIPLFNYLVPAWPQERLHFVDIKNLGQIDR
jgi:hypothetical protein